MGASGVVQDPGHRFLGGRQRCYAIDGLVRALEVGDDWARFVKSGLALDPGARYEQIFAALGA